MVHLTARIARGVYVVIGQLSRLIYAMSIKFSAEEMMEHERQWRLSGVMKLPLLLYAQLFIVKENGWVPHENYNAVREVISDLEGMWDVEMTGSPFPFKDGEHSHFLS